MVKLSDISLTFDPQLYRQKDISLRYSDFSQRRY